MTRHHKAVFAPVSVIGSGCSDLCGRGLPARNPPGVLLPGRRRLMRDENPSGSDSEEEWERAGSAALGSRKRLLCSLGCSGPEVVGEVGGSSGSPTRLHASCSSLVAVMGGPKIALCSAPGAATRDLIYVRAERVSLSQTFLTTCLVKRGSGSNGV